MIRFALPLLAVAATLMPAAASAQSLGDYVATPVDAARATKVTTRGTAWFPRDGRLLAARAPEAPAKLCQMVAKKVGPLSGFAAQGRAFDADALAQCNTAAVAGGAAVAAAN